MPDEVELTEDVFASMAEKLGGSFHDTGPAEADTPDVEAGDSVETTPGAPAHKEDATGRLHGEDGKFVPKVKEETPPEPADADTSDEVDPEVQAYLDKYGGDTTAALKAATDAQRLIGRKAEDVAAHELAARDASIKALEERLERHQRDVEERLAISPHEMQELLEEDPKQAAIEAYRQGDLQTLTQAVNNWAAEGPQESFQATQFWNGVQKAIETFNAEQAASAQPPPLTEGDNAPVAAVIQSHADDIEQLLPAIGQAMNDHPLLKQGLQYGDPGQKAHALESLYSIAKSRHVADTSSTAEKDARIRAAEEAQQARAEAAVVSSGRSSAASGQPTWADTFRRDFRVAAGIDPDA